MEEKKSQKSNKNLYLPLWVSEVLDIEGEKYDGPGEVAAAAIVAFASLLDDQKKKVFSTYRAKQIEAMHRDQSLEKKAVRQKKEQSHQKAKQPAHQAKSSKAG